MHDLRIQLEQGISVSTPLLAGELSEAIFPRAAELPGKQGVRLFQQDGLLIGHVRAPVADDFAAVADALYARVLAAARGRELYRIWNYVPRINAFSDGLENYRAFCLGRSRAFEKEFGAGFAGRLPAASGVGCDGREIDVIFAAGAERPAHWENPEQMPAYRYPVEHGPRSPSFARATTVAADGTQWLFISGTAAIKGHQSLGLGDLGRQIEITLDNLRLISKTAGWGRELSGAGKNRRGQRHFKVYLRRAEDLAATRAALDNSFLQAGDRVSYVRSDICRAELDVEIEATVVVPPAA